MTSPIVCAIDDSDRARAVANIAADLAERLDLELIGAHAVPALPLTTAGIPYPVPSAAEALGGAESSAAARVADVLRSAGVAAPRVRVAVGAVAHVLVRIADEEGARMIVLCAGGAGPLRSLVLASVTDAVVRTAQRPVLAIPPGVCSDRVRLGAGPVLAALASSRDASWIPLAEELALAQGGALLLAHVLEAEAGADPALAEGIARVEAFEPALRVLGDTRARVETRTRCGDVADELARLASESEAWLVVAGCHGHSRLDLALSPARRLLREASTPVLFCPSAARGGDHRP
jgi:nucleotide-binding universal stress UspA family protein